MDGFMAMAADPEFLADAKKLNKDVGQVNRARRIPYCAATRHKKLKM
jgi:hypothetical protein